MRPFLAARRVAGALAHVLHGVWIANTGFDRLDAASRRARVQWWSSGMVARMGLDRQVHGTPPEGAVLVVSNHVSWLDIASLHACMPRVRFVSKAAVGHWPLVGNLARTARTLFIERERKRDALRVVHEVAAALADGDAIAVFPEGTTGPGDSVLPFHANLLQAAISAGVPVQPVVLHYVEPGHRTSVAARYTGGTTLVGSVLRLSGARGVGVHVHFLEPVPPGETDRRTLAALLQARIAAGLAAAAGD